MKQQATIVTIALFIMIQGCNFKNDHKRMDTEPTPMSYLALGDSYTIGESVAESERWPVKLVESMRTGGVSISDPLIIARTGWTTDELAKGITDAGPEGSYDLVSLLVGVNNQYRGRDVENFREEFRELLATAIGYAGNRRDRLVVLSIPDWGVTPFASGRDREKIGHEIDLFNNVIMEECRERELLFIDVTAISREAATDSTLLAPDGLHPSGRMYGLWVKELLPHALRIAGSGR